MRARSGQVVLEIRAGEVRAALLETGSAVTLRPRGDGKSEPSFNEDR